MSVSDKPALVTGASGFVGSAVARALLAAGRKVRVLVRPSSDRHNIAGLDVEIRHGSLEDHDCFDAALAGCGALFHVAADYRLWVRDPAAMHRANVDGTRALMIAALAAGVERIVYTSSVATIGLTPDGSPADERTPSTIDDMIGPYKSSKFLAERAVDALVRQRGLPAVIAVRFAPIAPYWVVNVVAGAIRIRFWHFLVGTGIGIVPGLLAATVYGNQVGAALEDPRGINYWLVGAVTVFFAAAIVIVRAWLLRLEREQLRREEEAAQRKSPRRMCQAGLA